MITNTIDTPFCFWKSKRFNMYSNRKRLTEKHKYLKEHKSEIRERVSALHNARYKSAARRKKLKKISNQLKEFAIIFTLRMLQGLPLAKFLGLFGWIAVLLFLMDDDN